ncbi:MAG: transposase family protein, partial [Spirochaetales bacterium]|nr:transposase family protein [Spirochaetales bacterium]
MSVDLVNLPKARDLATKRVVRYGLVATALVPVFDSPPGDEPPADEKPVDVEKPPDAPRPMETVDACWGEGLEEKEYSLQGDETVETDPPGSSVENVKDHDGGDGHETDYEPSIMGDDELEKWESKCLEKAVGELSQPVKVRHVTLMEPVESRNVKHVMPAMDTLVTRMRYMGVCVTRIHSDRAKELLSKRFRSWVAQRNMMHTFTAGDDPQSNGHCE